MNEENVKNEVVTESTNTENKPKRVNAIANIPVYNFWNEFCSDIELTISRAFISFNISNNPSIIE